MADGKIDKERHRDTRLLYYEYNLYFVLNSLITIILIKISISIKWLLVIYYTINRLSTILLQDFNEFHIKFLLQTKQWDP